MKNLAIALAVVSMGVPVIGQETGKLWCEYPGGSGPGELRHVVLISGDEEYRSEESLPMLGKILAQRHGFRCTVLFAINPLDGTINPNEQHNIPGMEALATADLVIMALRYRSLPDEQMKFFVDYVDAGKPIIGLRTSTHAFNYPNESQSPYAYFGHNEGRWPGGFGKHVLGETWVSHHGNHKVESTRGIIVGEHQQHPILRGVRDVWGPTDVYGVNQLPSSATVLLRGQVLQGMKPEDPPVAGEKNDPMMPLAWTNAYESESGKTARVFCTTMGASQDFACEDLRRLIVNASYWCLGMDEQIPERADVRTVGDFAPTPYGFDAFTPGRRPFDHALAPDSPGQDDRLAPLKTLDDHFPFEPPATIDAWKARAATVRDRILVSLGLYPMPLKTPLCAVIHGKVDCGDYTIEKVYFQSLPGFFVSGSLFRPKNQPGPHPGVLAPHGHWNDGRFYDAGPEAAAREIASGAEFDTDAARVPLQACCVHMARLGCVVLHYDMIGYADCQQLPKQLAHDFSRLRPEMNSNAALGLFSPQAESRLQSVMGLQTWNSLRALDLLEALPDVDRTKIAMTGGSGGGTQTMILAAIDPRLHSIFPAVMVSTSMQGGCTCENASLLRIGTGNVEFASLFAPKPQGLTSANDWTKDMSRDGFPQLQRVYQLWGKSRNVRLSEHLEFGHNYNAVSRRAIYELFNESLGLNGDLVERPFPRRSAAELSVWDADHPPPEGGDDFERRLLQYWNCDSERQLMRLGLNDVAEHRNCKRFMQPVFRTLFGTMTPSASVSWRRQSAVSNSEWTEELGAFVNSERAEATPAIVIRPTVNWNSRYAICLDKNGKSWVRGDAGLAEAARRLLNSGFGVVGIDCFWQGDLLPEGASPSQCRLVENGREAAGYTFGYNDGTFVRRVRDVLNAIAGLSNDPQVKIDLVATGVMAPVGAVARTLTGSAVQRAAIDTGGFRFADINDLRDVNFLPGGAKYGDLPFMVALGSPADLWLAGESGSGDWIDRFYQADGAADHLHRAPPSENPFDWLLEKRGQAHLLNAGEGMLD